MIVDTAVAGSIRIDRTTDIGRVGVIDAASIADKIFGYWSTPLSGKIEVIRPIGISIQSTLMVVVGS